MLTIFSRGFISRIAVLLFFFTSNQIIFSQNINLSFPDGIEACNSSITLLVDIENTIGDTIDAGTIVIDLTGNPGLEYLNLSMQIDGPLITESIPGTPEFTFSSDFLDNDNITFELELSLGCEGATVSMPMVSLNFNYDVEGASSMISEDLMGYSIASPDITIPVSTPSGINGVIGYEFSINNTVINTGTADADSVFYCVEDNSNASLVSIEIGGVMQSISTSSIPGFTCYDIGSLAMGTDVVVVENWVITTCSAPVQNLFRKASFGCDGEIDCQMLPDIAFPSTDLMLVAPVSPLDIMTSNPADIDICSGPDTICVIIENSNGNNFVVQNIKAALSVPNGV
ncbi:MAG: hypothetical protein AAGA77_04055, partial [Bacteroidota bacterium]